MTNVDLEVLSRFDAVWARVQAGRQTDTAESETDWREGLLQGLYELCCGYEEMARAAGGGMKGSLQKLAVCTRRMLQSLQTEYFLDTGDLFIYGDTADFASCTMSNLRNLWQRTVALQDLLPKDGACDGLCGSVGDQLVRQGEILRGLVHGMLA